MVYSICGFNVEYTPKYPRLRDRSEKYLAEDESVDIDISFEVTEEEIDEHLKTYDVTRDLAEYVLAGKTFYKKIISKGAFFLHSAALSVDGYGFMFTGPCGAGKSTHATLWRKYFKENVISVNDDKPVIRIIDGTPFVCGTPFSGKFDINANVMVPLCGISILSQTPENTIEKVESSKAISVLMEQTLRPKDPINMLNLMGLLDETLRKVPVYSFGCNISPEAVELSYTTMKPSE